MILAVCGMRREAALLARVGIRALVGGGDARRLERELNERLSSPASAPFEGLLSFGVAGGLDPSIRAGDFVVASGVLSASPVSAGSPRSPRAWTSPESPLSAQSPLSPIAATSAESPLRAESSLAADGAWAAPLAAALPGARIGMILGQDTPVSSAVGKAAVFSATGALACDMESHVVAAVAARHGLPFAVIRAVSDPAHRSLPPAALAGFGADGRADVPAVLLALARDPRQLPALIRVGLEAERAFKALAAAAASLSLAPEGGYASADP